MASILLHAAKKRKNNREFTAIPLQELSVVLHFSENIITIIWRFFMLTISRAHVTGYISKLDSPAACCNSGDTVIFETRDCYDDAVTSEERPLGDRPAEECMENPATGPLYVEGAMPGDILKVEILDITTRSWGVMRSSVTCGAFRGCFDKRTARIFDLSQGKIQFTDKLALDIDTMIGVIGTAPAGDGVTTDTPGAHGGNMDCRKIVKGTTLYLPVAVEGALLSMGDLHAKMGDGEVLICGLETAGAVTVRVTVEKNNPVPTPFLENETHIMTIQSAPTLEEASLLASNLMKDYVKTVTGMDDFHAGMLLSLCGNLIICQIVDPWMTVRMELSKDLLRPYLV